MMKYWAIAAAALLGLSACDKDETITAYGAAGKTWSLVELDGEAFPASATLTFPEPGQFSGRAPCNSFSGSVTVPYPWFEAGPVAATRAFCQDQEAEDRFFQALGAVTIAEVAGDTLELSNPDDGRSMVFKAAE
ncbi:MAG: META domain-containing protein [Roseobacter sp.]